MGVVSAPPVDTSQAFESREYSLFFQDFKTLFFFFFFFFGWVVNKAFFGGVTNSEHIFNIDFTRTLKNLKEFPVFFCCVIMQSIIANKYKSVT